MAASGGTYGCRFLATGSPRSIRLCPRPHPGGTVPSHIREALYGRRPSRSTDLAREPRCLWPGSRRRQCPPLRRLQREREGNERIPRLQLNSKLQQGKIRQAARTDGEVEESV